MTTFLIEHTRQREGGTHIPMPSGITYHFAPTPTDTRHIAEVENTDDFTRFVRIGADLGTFVLLGSSGAESTEVTAAPGAVRVAQPAAGGGEPPAAADAEKPKDAPVASAPVTPAVAPDASASDAGDGKTSAETTNTPKDVPLEELSDEDLFAKAEAVLGKKQHPNSGRDTLIAKINTAISEA